MPRRELAFVKPMAARLVAALPTSDEWLFEPKLDGYRVLALKHGPRVRLLSRNNKDLTSDFSQVAKAVAAVNAATALLDGERPAS